MARLFLNLLWFWIGVIAIAVAWNLLGPSRHTLWSTSALPKLEQLARELATNPEREYVLVAGTSLISHNFVPEAFEESLRDAGGPHVSVLNLGLVASDRHESDYYLRRAIEWLRTRGLHPPRWVIIDYTKPHDFAIEDHNRFTRRAIEWHTPAQSFRVVRTLALSDESLIDKLMLGTLHFAHMVRRYLPYGQARDAIAGDVYTGGAYYIGYAPYADENRSVAGHMFRSNPEFYLQRVKEKREQIKSGARLERPDLRSVRQMHRWLESRGAEPIYIIPPTLFDTSLPYALHAAGILPNLLAYDDPDQYRDAYAVENRYDHDHLTNQMSVKWTRLVARDIATSFLTDASPASARDTRSSATRTTSPAINSAPPATKEKAAEAPLASAADSF